MLEEEGLVWDVIEDAEAIGEDCDSRPLDFAKWTIPQARFLRSCAKRKLFRAGNRSGKTRSCIGDVIFRAYGQHPYRDVRPGPTHQWVVCVSWDQAVPIMKAFHELVDYRRVRKAREFREKDGYGKDSPLIEFENGSTVRFKTMDQGTRRHAGAELDHIFIDEPPGSGHYRELERRVSSTNGDITIGLTPINAPEPLDWLIELTKTDVIEDHHVRMTPAAYTFEDGTVRKLGDGTVLDQDWIDEQRRVVLPRFAPVILDGEWNLNVEGATFQAFNHAEHVTDDYPPGDTWKIALGIDHGTGLGFSQVGLLLAVEPAARGQIPKVWVVAEDVSQGDTTPLDDARRYTGMLRQHGLEWSDLDVVYGDKSHQGHWGGVSRKSNKMLAEALATHMSLHSPDDLEPGINQAKTGKGGGRGSIWYGAMWLHHCMITPGHFKVHSSCERLIQSIERWDWKDNEWKHAIDTLRYGTWEWAMKGRQGGASIHLYGAAR
jgi:phage terminase large subunit-like protein